MRCYHCNNQAETKSYREIDGVTGKEVTCRRCMFTNNDIVLLTRSRFEEGDEYWSIDMTPDQEHIIVLNSCWDDVSEEILDNERFATLADAKKWIKAMYDVSHVLVSDYRNARRMVEQTT